MNDQDKSREQLLADLAHLRAQVAAQDGARPEDERVRLLASLVQHASDLVLVVAGDTTIQYASPSAEPLLGYLPEELVGMAGLALVHPDDLPVAEAALWQATHEPDAPLHLEIRLRRKDGTWRYFDTIARSLLHDPTVRAIVTNSRDITDRKQTEAALMEAKRQLEIILGGVADGITAQDPTGTLIYANDAAARLSGFHSAQPFLAASIPEIMRQFEVMDEEGHPIPVTQLPGRRALQGEEAPDAILRFRLLATGEERWSVVKATPVFDERGQVQFAINIFRDFTERKRLEDDLRFLAEASAILATSLDYEITLQDVTRLVLHHLADFCVIDLVGPTGELERVALAAAQPEQEAVLREIHARHPPPPQIGPLRVLASGQSEFYGDLSGADLSQASTDPHYLALLRQLKLQSVLIVPLIVRGRILGTLTLATTGARQRYQSSDLPLAEEVGRRAAVAVDNARLYQEAQQAIKLYKQFLAVASHELKTPLTTIRGYTGLLQRRMEKVEVVDETLRHQSHLIHSETERLARLIDLLLDFSRLQSGTLRLNREAMDLTALVARLVAMLQPTLARHRLQVEGGVEALRVEGDALRLEQILLNLLTNAVKYSPDGGTITVRLERAPPFGRVAVIDRGVGIPEAHLAYLFGEFYRIESPTMQSIPGMGLGLYIVRHLVEAHGGSVEVVSQEGHGSTFTVALPLAIPSEGEKERGGEGETRQ